MFRTSQPGAARHGPPGPADFEPESLVRLVTAYSRSLPSSDSDCQCRQSASEWAKSDSLAAPGPLSNGAAGSDAATGAAATFTVTSPGRNHGQTTTTGGGGRRWSLTRDSDGGRGGPATPALRDISVGPVAGSLSAPHDH